MNYVIKRVDFNRIEEAFDMVMDVFMEFDAPDYTDEGIELFKKYYIESEEFKNRFKTQEQIMIGAFLDNKIIGVLSISIRNYISLIFIDKKYHRMGIATELFNEILKDCKNRNVSKINLNASLYAIPFYLKLGFIIKDKKKSENGIVYVPMEFKI